MNLTHDQITIKNEQFYNEKIDILKSEKATIILFDGECNFCNSTVNFIIKNEQGSSLFFSSLQSKAGQKILKDNRLPADNKSILFLADGVVHQRSEAVLNILAKMRRPYYYLVVFKILPLWFRDFIYNVVAKHRKSIVTKKVSCEIPSPQVLDKFLM